MANKETYYEAVIKNFANEEQVVEFLNQPDIMNKWPDEDREYFIFKYLEDNGWYEADEPEPEAVVTKKSKKKE
jgi:hypothetical protein